MSNVAPTASAAAPLEASGAGLPAAAPPGDDANSEEGSDDEVPRCEHHSIHYRSPQDEYHDSSMFSLSDFETLHNDVCSLLFRCLLHNSFLARLTALPFCRFGWLVPNPSPP
jgi:hypothetical protein